MSESFAALFEESLQRSEMRTGEVITAEVVRIEHSFVVVNAGLKSEAYVPIEEFKSDKGELEVQVGDFVSVAIDSVENGYGDTILSRDKAKRLASWMSLEKALESGEFVTGTTSGKVKGGLTVLVNGIRAFLPGSLVDTRPTKDLSPYENKTMEFKVEINREQIFIKDNKVIRKVLLSEILWLESKGDYVKINTPQKQYIIHSTLKSMEDKLPAGDFVRIHRGFLIPVSKIDYIEDGVAFIMGTAVPVSETYKNDLLKKLHLI